LNTKKRFLKELAKLPASVQAQAEKVVFEDFRCENPFDLGYLEQMRGFPGKYKVRIGYYRIGVTIDKKEKSDSLRQDCPSEEHLSNFSIDESHNHINTIGNGLPN